MTDQKIVPFLFEGERLVRVVTRDGAPWFVAADVCRVLGLAQPASVVRALDEDEKGVHISHTLGGPQEMLTVSESGLYALIFRSRKEEAVRFRKWVTFEILPAIRQTGKYEAPPANDIPLPSDRRSFPEWPLEEMRTKKGIGDLYRMVYGPQSAQWIMPQLGFPVPPAHLIENGRQMHLGMEDLPAHPSQASVTISFPTVIPGGKPNGQHPPAAE